ncbi:hypothetical protein [Fusibacter ferrireducens]|uniref:Lipoprotein n=1 Tax=Fusibacter ferrireducens TaxID=2785058 RepID=A0ABR9ZSD3_9FIRM|nr:hypothetical protein [Fusibacter ferrireducens]MBF4693373.1 hypothetical protein [Fusibacter ferrireducens]
MRNKWTGLYIVIVMLLILTGCNDQQTEDVSEHLLNLNDTAQDQNLQEDKSQTNDSQEKSSLENESEGQTYSKSIETNNTPALPSEGENIQSFIPNGWLLLDAVELDFNNDGFMDAVGVLEIDGSDMTEDDLYNFPRILFAIKNSGDKRYELSFQDANLIRTEFEGGVFGDPYIELDVTDHNFSTHAYGGSSWKWSEDYTYSYRNDEWYLIKSVESYGQGPYITEYREDDYDLGIGKRSYNSENDEIMMQREMSWDAYDLDFDIVLEAPPRLKAFSAKNIRAGDRLKDMRAERVVVSEMLNLSDAQRAVVEQEAMSIRQICYTDEDYIAYTFKSEAEKYEYLAIYDRYLGVSTVVDRCERWEADWLSKFDHVVMDQEYIYYHSYYAPNSMDAESSEFVGTANELAFTYLYREKRDGTDKKMLFKYENETDARGDYPYVSITFEIHAGKIIFTLFSGQEYAHYKMNLDGDALELLGRLEN